MINISLMGNLLIYYILVTEGLTGVALNFAILLFLNLITVKVLLKVPGTESESKLVFYKRLYLGGWGIVSALFYFMPIVSSDYRSAYAANIIITMLIVYANYFQVIRSTHEDKKHRFEINIGTLVLLVLTLLEIGMGDLGGGLLAIAFILYITYKRRSVLRQKAFFIQNMIYIIVLMGIMVYTVNVFGRLLDPVGAVLEALNQSGPVDASGLPPRQESSWQTDPPISDQILFTIPIERDRVNLLEPIYIKHGTYETYQANIWTDTSLYREIKSNESFFQAMNFQYERLLAMLEEIEPEGVVSTILEKPVATTYEAEIMVRDPMRGITPVGTRSVTPHGQVAYKGDGIVVGDVDLTFSWIDREEDSREMAFIRYLNKERYQEILGWIQQYDEAWYLELQEQNAMLELEKLYKDYLQLPHNVDSRIKELAQRIVSESTSDYEKAEAIEQFLSMGEYRYVTGASQAGFGEDSVSHFLFESKEGICQQFAASMVLLSRSVGLPARYVTGYVTNEYDLESGELIIRERNGHAYVEVYIHGVGWVKFEPTTPNGIPTNQSGGIEMVHIAVGAIFISVVAVLFFFVKEVILLGTILMSSDKKAMNLIKEKLERQLRFQFGVIKKGETFEEYATKIKVYTANKITIDDIVYRYNEVIYGGATLNKKDRLLFIKHCYTILIPLFKNLLWDIRSKTTKEDTSVKNK